MTKYASDIFLSKFLLSGYELLTGQEATDYMLEQGFTHIHIDDDERIHALSKANEHLEGIYLYRRRRVVL